MMREYVIIDKGDCWLSDEVFDEDLYECVITLAEARHAHEMREALGSLEDCLVRCEDCDGSGVSEIDQISSCTYCQGRGVKILASVIDIAIEATELLATITKEESE